MRRCSNCGNTEQDSARFCSVCGAIMKDDTDSTSAENQKRGGNRKYIAVIIVLVILIAAVSAVLIAALPGIGNSDDAEEQSDSAALEESIAADQSDGSDAGETENTEPIETGNEAAEDDTAAAETESESAETSSPEEAFSDAETESDSSDEDDEDQSVSDEAAEDEDITDSADMSAMADTVSVQIASVSATSELSEYQMTHFASRIADDDLTTAWVEGADGYGIGESVTLALEASCGVSGFTIYAGYQKTAELYAKNARPEEITLTFSNGESLSFTLADLNGPQTFYFAESIVTDSVTLTICSVYEGTTYEDTVITEIILF